MGLAVKVGARHYAPGRVVGKAPGLAFFVGEPGQAIFAVVVIFDVGAVGVGASAQFVQAAVGKPGLVPGSIGVEQQVVFGDR
jgi:hypothetical protein